MSITAVIFDLAGVLLDFRGPASLSTLSEQRISEKQFSLFWETQIAIAFTKGHCGEQCFLKGLAEYFGLESDVHCLLENYKTWYQGPYVGALDLVREVRGHVKTGCLSNTNVLDVARFRSDLGLPSLMDICAFSCEIESAKPEPEAYMYAAERIKEPTHKILFLDDSATCVAGAESVGMKAVQVVGPEEARQALSSFGVISGAA